MRPKIKEEHPNAKFGELSKLLSEKWKSLTEEQKKSYKNKEEKIQF
jgi:high mobility group protein B1